jgi:hypothetical protein
MRAEYREIARLDGQVIDARDWTVEIAHSRDDARAGTPRRAVR